MANERYEEMGKTIEALAKKEQYIREVDEERKKGLAEGEHYYTLFWGHSDAGGGDRGWMGNIKARTMDDCEKFVKNEILTAIGRNDIYNEDGDGEEWAIIQMSGEDVQEDESEDEKEEDTNYIEIKRDDKEMPDTSIFGDKTFWDLTG